MMTKRGTGTPPGSMTVTGASTTTDGYRYDLFLSYRRAGNVELWVQNHLRPVLDECLTDHVGHPPRIFIDTGIQTGSRWPASLRHALRRSRILVPVLSAGYFKTPWCRAEWSTFADREKSCGGVALLIYPILHSGMRALPAEALERQLADFRQWNFPYPQFRQNQRYLSFHRAIETVADELAQRCSQAPEWTQNWPVHAPRNPSARTGLDTWSLPKW